MTLCISNQTDVYFASGPSISLDVRSFPSPENPEYLLLGNKNECQRVYWVQNTFRRITRLARLVLNRLGV